VKHGLDSFKGCKRVGLEELMKEAKIDGHEITPYEIGFIIAPRINAIGRLEHALDALRLLCTPNSERARELASKVGQLNEDRKSLVDTAVKEAKKQVNDKIVKGEMPKILILKSDDWHEGIIGLIASKMVEAYQRTFAFIVFKKLFENFWLRQLMMQKRIVMQNQVIFMITNIKLNTKIFWNFFKL
jgi:single-stranded-DNA-specific exonuclease